MAQVKWRRKAIADIERLRGFLYEKDPAVASRAVRVIQQAALALETSPRIGRPMLDATKRRELFLPFGADAYVIRYFLVNNNVVVTRVWHSKENRQ